MARRPRFPNPFQFFTFGLSSAEVIARRTALMLKGTCTPAEYGRMVGEKASLGLATALRLSSGRMPGADALLAPWRSAVGANVKRLRRKKT
jgi:hypothetical protein